MAKKLSQGNSERKQQLVSYSKECVKPAYNYFKHKFNNNLQQTVKAFKAAQYFSPSRISEVQPTASDIGGLRSFPFLDSNAVMDNLNSELPYYMAAVDGVASTVDAVQWWKGHNKSSPTGLVPLN